MFVIFSVQASEPENKSDKQIEKLSKKAFLYSNSKGKQSLKLITGYTVHMANPEWYKDGCPESCNNTIAVLYSPHSAVPLPGTPLIMAFLDCPACREGTVIGAEFVMAMFNRNNINEPLCFQHIDLMGKEKDKFYYYQIEPIEIRKNIERGYYSVVKLFGGDGMDSWSSLVFLFSDNNCGTTILSRLYEDLSLYEQEDGKRCRGKKLYCHFLDDHTVNVITEDPCTGTNENDVLKSHNKYDLKSLLENPKTRIFQP